MSKFCSNCGAQMEDQAVFCPNCGATNEAAPVAQQAPAENKVAAAASEYLGKASTAVTGYVGKAKKNPKVLLVPVVAIVAVIAVIIACSLLFKYNGAAGAVNRLLDVQAEGKSGQIKNLAPKEVWEYYDDVYETSQKDVKEYFDDEMKEDIRDNNEDDYGKNYKATFKKKDQDDAKKDELSAVKEYLSEKYDIKKDAVKKLVKVDGEMVIKGSEDDDDADVDDLYVVKIGSKWYQVSVNTYEGEDGLEASVSFPVEGLIQSAAHEKHGDELWDRCMMAKEL